MSDYIIYTDGACSGNPGPGGWGVVICDSNNNYITELSGGEPDTTNNRMELTAVIRGLLAATPIRSNILIVTDSKYIVDSINKGWARNWASNGWYKSDGKPALNSDLWKRSLSLIDDHHTVEFKWVKGHAGHPQNERCDELARNEINKIRGLYG